MLKYIISFCIILFTQGCAPTNFSIEKMNSCTEFQKIWESKSNHHSSIQLPNEYQSYLLKNEKKWLEYLKDDAIRAKKIVLPYKNKCILVELENASIMNTELAQKYPNIRAFKGSTTENPNLLIRLNIDQSKLSVAFTEANEYYFLENIVFFDPNIEIESTYIFFNKNNAPKSKQPFEINH